MEDIHVPPLIQNGQPKNDPNEKDNAFNQYFQSQRELDESNTPGPLLPKSDFPCLHLNSTHRRSKAH